MEISIEYIEGQIKATATNKRGNTASWSEDLGLCIASVYDKECTDAHFDNENLIKGVVYASQTAARCAIGLLTDTFKEEVIKEQRKAIEAEMLAPIVEPTHYSGFETKSDE
jgi:hypothetical protein